MSSCIWVLRMTPLHTHYDNLKVSRDAPQEVIRASYKALAQKYHPDKNNGDPEASRITAAINMSYEELSNPKLRLEHDRWIAAQELRAAITTKAADTVNRASTIEVGASQPAPMDTTGKHSPAASRSPTYDGGRQIGTNFAKFWPLYLLLGIGVWLYNDTSSSTPVPTAVGHGGRPAYARPLVDPNGQVWPSKASYLTGSDRLNRGGLSSVSIDNSLLDSDVLVKLVSLDAARPVTVRQFFIPAGASFKVGKIKPGRYDIRYRDLDSGSLSRSEQFTLTEAPGVGGTQFSNITMTLYKVRNGNMKTYGLLEEDF